MQDEQAIFQEGRRAGKYDRPNAVMSVCLCGCACRAGVMPAAGCGVGGISQVYVLI